MTSKQQLRKPENWQDFETLSKKLWGEIWDCPEIKKHGRSGQNQMGVDIYGIPKGEKDFYGIQCKGKDEYTHKQLTKKEILSDVEEAKNFKPPLIKLYIVTTANKDIKIEQFVRQLNLDQTKKGLFEVHLFSWEDIVDLIDENKNTHNWYVKNQGFKIKYGIKVTFEDGSDLLEMSIPFLKRLIHYEANPVYPNPAQIFRMLIQSIDPYCLHRWLFVPMEAFAGFLSV